MSQVVCSSLVQKSEAMWRNCYCNCIVLNMTEKMNQFGSTMKGEKEGARIQVKLTIIGK